MIAWLVIASYLISAPFRATGNASGTGLASTQPESVFVRKKWISEMMVDVEMRFDMKANVSDECRRDFGIYRLHAENQTVWAVRMMESTEWPRIGLFSGATAHFGHYAECLRSHGPGIRGQYCIAQATYNFTKPFFDRPVPGYISWPDEHASVWNVIRTYEKNPFRRSRRSLVWAMCIPSSCTSADLQTSLNNALYPVFKAQELDITVNVNPVLCQVDDPARAPIHHNSRSHVINFLLLMAVICTIYDLIFGNKRITRKFDSCIKFIKCFSMIENYKSLTQHSPTKTYRFLYFLKIIFMFVVIWGHAMVMNYMFPKFETEEMETALSPWSIELLGGVILNAFFMISGFLNAFHFDFSAKTDNGVHFFVRSVVMRYLRMVPVSGLMILMFYFTLPKLDDAPISNYVKLTEMKCCSSNWWTNMLAVQNFVDYREMCQPHSWHVAADVQLYVFGTVLLMVLKMNTTYGLCLMIITFVYSTLHSFFVIQSIGSHQLFTEFFTIDPMNYRESLATLFAFHTMTIYRVGPYLIGHVTAFVTKSLMNRGFKFSPMVSACLLLITSAIGFGIQLHGFSFFMVDRAIDPTAMAVFGTIQPILFVLPFASLICIYFVSGLGIFKPLFELTFYIPLGRLSYSVYLVGFGLQSSHVFNQRKMLSRFSKLEIYWWLMGDIAAILAFAVFFYFTCEGPANNLINLFIKPYLIKKKRKSQKEDANGRSQSSADIKGTESVRGRITCLDGGFRSPENEQTQIMSEQCGKQKLK